MYNHASFMQSKKQKRCFSLECLQREGAMCIAKENGEREKKLEIEMTRLV